MGEAPIIYGPVKLAAGETLIITIVSRLSGVNVVTTIFSLITSLAGPSPLRMRRSQAKTQRSNRLKPSHSETKRRDDEGPFGK